MDSKKTTSNHTTGAEEAVNVADLSITEEEVVTNMEAQEIKGTTTHSTTKEDIRLLIQTKMEKTRKQASQSAPPTGKEAAKQYINNER